MEAWISHLKGRRPPRGLWFSAGAVAETMGRAGAADCEGWGRRGKQFSKGKKGSRSRWSERQSSTARNGRADPFVFSIVKSLFLLFHSCFIHGTIWSSTRRPIQRQTTKVSMVWLALLLRSSVVSSSSFAYVYEVEGFAVVSFMCTYERTPVDQSPNRASQHNPVPARRWRWRWWQPRRSPRPGPAAP